MWKLPFGVSLSAPSQLNNVSFRVFCHDRMCFDFLSLLFVSRCVFRLALICLIVLCSLSGDELYGYMLLRGYDELQAFGLKFFVSLKPKTV